MANDTAQIQALKIVSDALIEDLARNNPERAASLRERLLDESKHKHREELNSELHRLISLIDEIHHSAKR